MASKVFEAKVHTAKDKKITQTVVVAGISDADPEEEGGIDEKWVKDHLQNVVHKGAKSIEVKPVEGPAPATGVAAIQRAAQETGDAALAEEAARAAAAQQQAETPAAPAQPAAKS